MRKTRFDSTDKNVFKFVYEFDTKGIAEAVLYKYKDFYKRTVLCVSVQCGCPVGCKFCGTGKQFIRNLTADEIIIQVKHSLANFGLSDINEKGERFQIMFMSMGEPMLNFNNVERAIRLLNVDFPKAELLISTVAPKKLEAFNQLLNLSKSVDKVGLQFSIHEALEHKRNELIPYKNKLTLRQIRDYGIAWNKVTNRPVYLNYCIGEKNQSREEMDRLKDLFTPSVFFMTFSVICSADETMKDKGYKELDRINAISTEFSEEGYNVRVFDPAGQDDIGGGCGQLWYVQDWMKKQKCNDVDTQALNIPVVKPRFDIERGDFYEYDKPKDRTRKRLTEIAECGMEEVMTAEFGYKGVMSGLYIERVWSYSDEDFKDYMNWAKGLIANSLKDND